MTHTNVRSHDTKKSEPTLLRKAIAVITLKRRLGNRDWVSYVVKTLILFRLLYHVFKFDQWHIHNTYENRPYKRMTVETLNALRPHVVVDIGCGLGEIISRVDAKVRVGIDTDRNALKAAKLLNWRKDVTFLEGSIGAAGGISQREIDCLIMVGWLHNTPESEISAELKHLLQHKRIRYLIVDEILGGVDGYKFHHKFREILRDSFVERAEVKDHEGIRRIVVLERKHNDRQSQTLQEIPFT